MQIRTRGEIIGSVTRNKTVLIPLEQKLTRELKAEGGHGIVYPSVQPRQMSHSLPSRNRSKCAVWVFFRQ